MQQEIAGSEPTVSLPSGGSIAIRYLSRLIVGAAFLSLAVFIVVPIAFVIYGAVRSDLPGVPEAHFTLDALRTVFLTRPYLLSVVGTVALALTVAAIAVFMGSLFAWLLTRTNLPAKKFLEIIVLAPVFLSPLVSALAWLTLGAPRSGVINVTMNTLFGIPNVINIMTLPGVVFVMSLAFIPYAYLFASSAFSNIDASYEEAAFLSGASPLRAALKITWPVARPTVLSAFLLISILAVGVFSVPAVLNNNMSFVPLAVRIQRAIQLSPPSYAVAAAVGIEVMLISIVGLFLYRRSVRATHRFVTVTGRSTRTRFIPLRRLKWFALGLFGLYGLLSVVLPYLALLLTAFTPYAITDLRKITLSFTIFKETLTSGNTLEALENTLMLGFLAPTICVIFALIISFGALRSRSLFSALTDYVATVPVAIPGVVFGTGMVWAFITTPLYATFWILLIAFVVHYLPYTYRLATNAALQIDKNLSEAARINGAGPERAWFRVVLPLSRPALLSAWILIFLFVTREVDVVIVLATPMTTLLSIATFDAEQFGVVQTAAVLGLLQTAVLVAGIVVARFIFRVKIQPGGLH